MENVKYSLISELILQKGLNIPFVNMSGYKISLNYKSVNSVNRPYLRHDDRHNYIYYKLFMFNRISCLGLSNSARYDSYFKTAPGQNDY